MGLQENIRRIVAGKCGDPFSILGMHVRKEKHEKGVEVRVFLPEAESVSREGFCRDREGSAWEITRAMQAATLAATTSASR